MFNFCTLFDSNYLSRGLVMYDSLKKHENDFHLYVFAFDNKAHEILKKLALDKVTVISLKDFESEELLSVKPGRSKAEYCWTCTPSTIKYVIEKYKVDNCTYIDADLYFYNSPKVLFDEMDNKSVLITEHRYSKKYDRSVIAGKYCVQFITFKNNIEGLKALNWWQQACIDWCYDRYEDGKFGDQKYLDDWTTRFEGVHVLQHLGGGIAPWNVQQYRLIKNKDNQLLFTTKQNLTNFVPVFYHYHYVRFYKNDLVDLGWFKLTKTIVEHFYKNYICDLENATVRIKQIDQGFDSGFRPFSIKESKRIKDKLKVLFKLITRYNLFDKKHFYKKSQIKKS